MADNRFPLFRVPFLALCIILNFYNPHDIIQLSLCSKRSLRVAKKCWKKKKLVKAILTAQVDKLVDVIFSDPACEYRFVISRAKFKYLQDEQVHRIRIGDAVVPSSHKKTETVTYWNDKIHGIEQVVSYIKDLFDVQIHTIDLNTEEYRNEFIRTMDCVMNLQGSVKECTLTGSYPIDDSLTHLLDNCQVTKELRIYGRPTRQFRNDWNIQSDHLHISYGSCLTYQDLTNINCKFLELHNSTLTIETLRMTGNRIPLFHIPLLALCIILDFYGPHEIIQLSLCSKRSLRVAKKCWKKKGSVQAYLTSERAPRIDLHFTYFGFYYRFLVLEVKDLHENQHTKNIRVGDAVVPSIHTRIGTVTYWKDKIHGIGQIVSFIKDLFDEPIDSIHLESKEYPNEFIDTLDCLMRRQESVRECVLGGEDDECMTHVLDNCKVTGELRIVGELSTQSSHNWNIDVDYLYIPNGLSFTFQNLMNMNCKFIWLGYSDFTNEDLNQFLKHWQNGGNSRIKKISIRINNYIYRNFINENAIISGIASVSRPRGLVRYYESSNGDLVLKYGGVHIQRYDGTIGTIFFSDDRFEFGVDPIEFETLRMTANRFPLFRLPFMALCIIMNLFSPHDIIQLSLCSKRSIQAAKKCWKKKGVIKTYFWAETVPNIDIFFYDPAFEYRFVISEAQDVKDQQMHNIRIGDEVVPSIYKDTETVTFWEDKIQGIGQVVGYIKDLFDVPIHSVNLETEEHPNDFIRIMDSIMSVQESIEECTLNGEDPIDDCLTHLLDNCKITGSLSIHEQPTSQFRNDWNIHLDDLYISNGSSITFQNLTNIDCQSLELRHGSSLTSEDANEFLKHWQNGGNSRIKFLSIRINPLIQETITSGIDFVLQPQGLRRYYRGMNNFKVLMSGGLDIRRNDGKTGSIFFHNNKFEFGVDPIED